MKKSSFRAQTMKRTFWVVHVSFYTFSSMCYTNFIGVVKMQQPTPALIHLLMALPRTSHCQCGIHVHVVACQIQTYEPLK